MSTYSVVNEAFKIYDASLTSFHSREYYEYLKFLTKSVRLLKVLSFALPLPSYKFTWITKNVL